MNIFVLDDNIKKAAEYHVDKHVVKMILESAQILSTVVRSTKVDKGYKSTHEKHPCVLWCKSSLSNWRWLKSLSEALNEEYKYRYNHINNHKSYDVILTLPEPKIIDVGLTNFAQAMPDEFRHVDPIVAYRNYYRNAKQHLAIWTKRSVPTWY